MAYNHLNSSVELKHHMHVDGNLQKGPKVGGASSAN